MEENYFRFLQLWPDGFWLWKNVETADFDFPQFVRALDLPAVRTMVDRANPPTGQDGDFLYQVGHYREAHDMLHLSFVHRVATTSGPPLEVPWTGSLEIRSPVVLWFVAANVRFEFVRGRAS